MAIRADLHVHPLLNTWLLKRDPGKEHRQPPFFLPFFNYVDYPRAHAGGLHCLFSVIYIPPIPWRDPMNEVTRIVKLAIEQAETSEVPVRIVRTAKEIRSAAGEGELALVHAVEGGHVLGKDVANVDRLALLGIRYLTLVHFVDNRIGGAATFPFQKERGLTRFGRMVIHRMYRSGIMADLSHCDVRTFWAALEEANGPVIASHTGARAYALGERNLEAQQAKAIAESGGVVGVLLCPWYLQAGRIVGSLTDFTRNVAYFSSLVGCEHVAIGSDLDGWLWPVREVRHIADYELIEEALVRMGFHSSEVKLIMGENLVNMLERFDER